MWDWAERQLEKEWRVVKGAPIAVSIFILIISCAIVYFIVWPVFEARYEDKYDIQEQRIALLNEQLQYQYKDNVKENEEIENLRKEIEKKPNSPPNGGVSGGLAVPELSVLLKMGSYLDHNPSLNKKFKTEIKFPILIVPISVKNLSNIPAIMDIYLAITRGDGKVQRYSASGARTVGMIGELTGYLRAVSPDKNFNHLLTPLRINARETLSGKCVFLLTLDDDLLIRDRLQGGRNTILLEFVDTFSKNQLIEPLPLY